MSTHDLPHMSSLSSTDALRISGYFIAIYLIYAVLSAIYNAYFGPLSKFPGPLSRKLSRLPELYTLYHGDEASELVRSHSKAIYGFRKHGQASLQKDPQFYGKSFNNVDGIITANDANHSRQRKLLSHTFADKTLKDLEPLLKSWVEKMRKKVDILKYYNCTTFDIMGDLSFSEGLDMLENSEYSSWVKTIFLGIKIDSRIRACKMINWFTEWFVNNFIMNNAKVSSAWSQMRMVVLTCRSATRSVCKYTSITTTQYKESIAGLQRTPDRPDLWTKILEKSKGPDGLSIKEHHSNASTFMVAGTETTATALSGVTYHLLRNPEYLQKLTQAIRGSHSSSEDITMESLQHLKYLHAVLQEGLRMYPPVPSMLPRRVPKGGAIVCDEFLPKGTSIGVHHLSTYRSEDNVKDPYKFAPERWLGDEKYKDDHLDSLEPFSVGPRNCIGKNLAWHEMRLILATTLFNFDLKLCEESKKWTDQKVYTLWEKIPLMVTLAPAAR
ncbi:Putative cytochrome P450 [Septoria linicola]|uniref:Cytochrome P450 n=1 Tax=Septoria linicola TaxID=215465 RepID=A0A9Q9ECH8_9PEZI|nr:Putative cytochrome P450 [Septoria linicola]